MANRGKGREWVILVAPMAGRGRTWLKAPVPSVMSRQPILDADPLIAGPRKGLEWTRTSSRPRQRRPEALESTVAPPARKSIRGTCTLSYRPCKPVRAGDFSARLPTDQIGLPGKIGDAFNDIVSANERMAQQLERVGQIVGREGKTRKRVRLGVTAGAWGEMEGSVNSLIDDLLWPTAAVTHAVTAVAQGDLQRTRSARR